MKQFIEVEITTEQAVRCLKELRLAKEQAEELRQSSPLRDMAYFPITVDEAIETISEANPDSAFTRMLTETQQMNLYKGLADNPRALSELANMVWDDKDVLAFLVARFGGRLKMKDDVLTNVKDFVETMMNY